MIAQVVAVARRLSEAEASQLAARLTRGELVLSAGALEVQQCLRIGATDIAAIVALLRQWQQGGGTAQELGIAILSARAGYQEARAQSPEVSLAWTGPALAPVRARSTSGVLLELIEKARSEIIIVGYTLTDGAAAIFQALVAAQQRRVRVMIAGDQLKQNLHVLRSHWPHDQRLPELYTRPVSRVDEKSALHAKLAIVDSQRMLVTSANLTYHGLAGNIEIGLVVTGKPVTEVVGLLTALIAAEELVELDVSE
jgi:phosphatidylserine/phosphatidylglycerophosphate/cardiolipin synthase-like enzyme